MYTSTIYFAACLLALVANAAPLQKRADITVQFIGGPASYTMTIPTDDVWHPTSDTQLNISKIKFPGDLTACQFQTYAPPAVAATATYVRSPDDNAVDVGPPQPIIAVKCPGAKV